MSLLLEKIIPGIFFKREILSSGKFYKFIDRKKITVFVPPLHAEAVISEMSKSGAGIIGNYIMCSFSTQGTGTFLPTKKARPVSGKKNILSIVDEIKVEMECSSEDINKVIDAMLHVHPYEEIAYEIYDFKKRVNGDDGFVISLKSGLRFSELLKRLNRNISEEDISEVKIKKIALTHKALDETIIRSAKFINCDCLVSILNKKYKLLKL